MSPKSVETIPRCTNCGEVTSDPGLCPRCIRWRDAERQLRTPSPSPETPAPLTCPTCKGSVLAWPDGDRVGFHSLDCKSTNAAASPPSAPREAPETPPLDGRTHYDGCWDTRGHHDCACEEITRLRFRLSASEARAAAAEQRADAEVEIKEEMFDNWTKAERRLVSLLEKVERLPRFYATTAGRLYDLTGDCLDRAAVRSLLAPSEDTSDG